MAITYRTKDGDEFVCDTPGEAAEVKARLGERAHVPAPARPASRPTPASTPAAAVPSVSAPSSGPKFRTKRAPSPAPREAREEEKKVRPEEDAAVLADLVRAGDKGILSADIFTVAGSGHGTDGLRGRAIRYALLEWTKKVGLLTSVSDPPMLESVRIAGARGWRLTAEGLARAKEVLRVDGATGESDQAS